MKRLLLFFIFVSTYTLPTVQPVVDGEGIWNVVSRIGETSDIIESKVCELDSPDVTNPKCDFLITQEDVGSGGVLTLTDTGIYCLAESITFTASPAIAIATNNVVVEMHGHTIEALESGLVAFDFTQIANYATIRNGTITAPEGSDLFAAVQIAGPDVFHATFKNLHISNVDYGFFIQNAAFLNFENCFIHANNTHNLTVLGASGSSGIYCQNSRSVVVHDCIAYRFADAAYTFSSCPAVDVRRSISRDSFVGFSFNNIDGLLARNCLASDSGSNGFAIDTVEGAFFDTCSVAQTGTLGTGDGFRIVNTCSDLAFYDCIVQQSASSGYHFLSGFFGGVIFDRCVAQSNNLDGFLLDGSATSTVSGFRFVNCTAQANDRTGFNLQSTSETPPSDGIFDIYIELSAASQNSGNGFELGSAVRQCTIFDCESVVNTGTGIYDASGMNFISGNRAFDNGLDISVITDTTMLVSESTAGDVANNGSYWVNAIS